MRSSRYNERMSEEQEFIHQISMKYENVEKWRVLRYIQTLWYAIVLFNVTTVPINFDSTTCIEDLKRFGLAVFW